MQPKLFDLHCDTATALFQSGQSFDQNDCQISLNQAKVFKEYCQIMAIWSDQKLDNEAAYQRFLAVSDFIHTELERTRDCFPLLKSGEQAKSSGAYLAVEDARILNGISERLGILYEKDIRILTLVWSGESCIGGAHNTSMGLTAFGKQVVKDCFSLGIVPDLSHASPRTIDEALAISEEYGKPVIASHSNAYAVCPHTRNLSDRHILAIGRSGGIVGLCLCPSHLAACRTHANITSVMRHIEHFYALGGEDFLALGCDLDGTELPRGFSSVADLSKIAEEMAKYGYSDQQIEKLFYRNAEYFVRKNI